MRGFLCGLVLIAMLFAGADCAGAAPPLADQDAAAVTITVPPDGGYLVDTPSYQARIGADGNLHSFTVNGVEFIDDNTANAMGASFYVEHPIPLPTLKLNRQEITATDGIYTVRYLFAPGYVTLTLKHTNPPNVGAAYVAVCSPKVAYIEDLSVNTMAVAPVDYHWANVKVTVPTGEYLEFWGGSRVWGREIDRQVWECSRIIPNKDYILRLIPGRGTPPAPDLGRLTNLTATMNVPDQLVPSGGTAAIQVQFENNSNQQITSELAMHIESMQHAVLLDEKKPLTCAPHQSVTETLTALPKDADFYHVTCTVNLDGTPKTLETTFGYNLPAIQPTTQRPADFTTYWGRIVAEARAADVKLKPLEDTTRSTGTVRVYEVGIEVDGVKQFSGWLSVPKFPGRYPGLLILPSDRVRMIGPSTTLADCGFVVLSIDPMNQSVRSPLKPLITQASVDFTNREKFGMRAVMIRYLQAVTALASSAELRPAIPVDPNRIAVTGAGLGGGLAMILAALDERVQAIAPDAPYYCQIPLGSDAPDWPYLEVDAFLREHPEQREKVLETLSYYDVANFADQVTCPTLISAYINDTYAIPTNIVGVYNRLPGPRALTVYLVGHEGAGARQWEDKIRWLTKVLGGPGPAPVSSEANPAVGEEAKPVLTEPVKMPAPPAPEPVKEPPQPPTAQPAPSPATDTPAETQKAAM